MKIGVVGTFNRDRIISFQGKESESVGGIFFTVSYLANLFGPQAQIYPVSVVGDGFFSDLAAQLGVYDNVSLDGLKCSAHPHVQVVLTYTGPQERTETTTPLMPPLESEDLAILADADWVLVNLISGWDLQLEALQQLKQQTGTSTYLDFHYRATRIDEGGKRHWHRPDDWRAWVDAVDVLQLNEVEARTLAGLDEQDEEGLIEFGLSALEQTPSVCHITMGESGSHLFFGKDGSSHHEHFPGVHVAEVVDVTDCGDAFATGFLYDLHLRGDVRAATQFANGIAALNATFAGSDGIAGIRQRIQTGS